MYSISSFLISILRSTVWMFFWCTSCKYSQYGCVGLGGLTLECAIDGCCADRDFDWSPALNCALPLLHSPSLFESCSGLSSSILSSDHLLGFCLLELLWCWLPARKGMPSLPADAEYCMVLSIGSVASGSTGAGGTNQAQLLLELELEEEEP